VKKSQKEPLLELEKRGRGSNQSLRSRWGRGLKARKKPVSKKKGKEKKELALYPSKNSLRPRQRKKQRLLRPEEKGQLPTDLSQKKGEEKRARRQRRKTSHYREGEDTPLKGRSSRAPREKKNKNCST